MAGTSLDMTVPRPGSLSQVYGVFGAVDLAAATVQDALAHGAAVHQIPVDVLIALESGGAVLRAEALAQVRGLDARPFVGAVGYDDWWTAALDRLNPDFALSRPRHLVNDKAAVYELLAGAGIRVPRFRVGQVDEGFIGDAIADLGPRPVLKPTLGAGSRGVYRYRDDLSVVENLDHYGGICRYEKIPPGIRTLAMEYVEALEVSVDFVYSGGRTHAPVVHEKVTAKDRHPFVDRVMVSPPVNPEINKAMAALADVVDRLAPVLGVSEGALHAELRLRDGIWYVLDVGIRPGMGLVGHAMQAITGVDPRLAHLRASLGMSAAAPGAPSRFQAACIACCYVDSAHRISTTMQRYAGINNALRADPTVFGWHLNVSEINDALYRPDAGMSIGVGADGGEAAIVALKTLVTRHGFSTE